MVKMIIYRLEVMKSISIIYTNKINHGRSNEAGIEKSSDRNGIENMNGSRTIFQIENK